MGHSVAEVLLCQPLSKPNSKHPAVWQPLGRTRLVDQSCYVALACPMLGPKDCKQAWACCSSLEC